jgi:hypothetical protein
MMLSPADHVRHAETTVEDLVCVLSCQLLTIGHAVLCGPSKSLMMVIVAP